MVNELPDELQSRQMTDTEIDVFLRGEGTGVLSLAQQQDAYGIPLSYGYLGRPWLYFVFLNLGPESKKVTFGRETEQASFLVYDVESRFNWRSVVITGSLEEITDDEWEVAVEAIEDNAWYPSLFRQAAPMQGVGGWKLRMDNVSGLKGEEG